MGTYLVTYHTQGIKLWGGNDFVSLGRFMHPNVETMEFSPCETYIITYSADPFPPGYNHHAHNNAPVENIIVWNVITGAKLRAFTYKNALDVKMQVQVILTEEAKGGKKVERLIRGKVTAYDERTYKYTIAEDSVLHHDIAADKVQAMQNPNVLKWSHDGKFLARLSADAIQVYELPTLKLLDNKSFAAKDMLNFCWSPKQNMLSYWSPTSGNLPAMINIVSVDRTVLCSRKCFDILEGHMVWQSEGDYLCVYMTKFQNKKRSYVVMFFRVKEPEVPVELLELTEPIIHIAWEPSGERVSIVHGESKAAKVAIYSMTSTTKNSKSGASTTVKLLTLVTTVSNVPCTENIWSPAGGITAIAHFVTGDSCTFQLYDIDNNVALATRKHERCTGLYWDPSGRIIASTTTSPMINGNIIRGAPLQVDDSYNLWSFQGAPICVVRKEKLYKFIWRPRPNNLLTLEARKAIVKNLKKYEKIFEREDKIRKAEIYQENTAKRNAVAAAFLAHLAQRKADLQNNYGGNQWKVVVRDGYDEDDDSNYEIISQVSILSSI